ncbi:hypothetical protein [Acetobacterium bakii]|uniref:hypothetical protein n=1 Tax=Acetobacterium bakii TaxID=52689 RepID=UPI001364C2E3|nr:hypothetical protein [Acetobacterium bakii]
MDKTKLIVRTGQEYVSAKRLIIPSKMAAVENASKEGVDTAIFMIKNPQSTYEM